MRKILSSVLMLAAGMVLLNSCEKVDVPQDVNTLGKGSYVTLVKSTNLLLDFSNLAGSKAAIDVQEYGAEQEKLTIYVAPGTPTQDRTKWKKVKEVPNDNDGLYNLSVSGTEIATAIAPTVISPGNQYTMYNVITTKDGRTFDFANTATGFSGNPNYNMAMTWSATVICPFVAPIGGKYIVVQDDWVDWSPGAEVDVTDGPGANQVNISKVWPNPAYGSVINPLVINVTPSTGAATIPSGLVWGNYGSYNASTLSPNSGFVFSCTGQIIMNIRIDASGFGDQGAFNLILKKK
jgi:hypothetical protein